MPSASFLSTRAFPFYICRPTPQSQINWRQTSFPLPRNPCMHTARLLRVILCDAPCLHFLTTSATQIRNPPESPRWPPWSSTLCFLLFICSSQCVWHLSAELAAINSCFSGFHGAKLPCMSSHFCVSSQPLWTENLPVGPFTTGGCLGESHGG